ncbi:MAG: undecaprenyldiphospho-muramoylpentapeptide beta-N-acetylglucosaminyltransferase [Gammaproteobacteria bacterium]|nr:undecaprenyldiphospho-muramoylpentapeptide beta-N-acetylglucosaminyltransferase [Gammaproteobacteria bacterium]
MSRGAPHVLIMAGGTGGHIYPGLAVAGELRGRGCEVNWLGTQNGLETLLVPKAGFPLHFIDISGLRGKGFVNWVRAPARVLHASLQAAAHINTLAPDVVLGMGGFAAGPGGLVAWLMRRALVVHEQNAAPGLTNRILSKIARRVLEAFPDTFSSSRTHTVGNPVRGDIAAVAPMIEHQGPTRLLVLGGSQGALALNRLMPEALGLVSASFCVTHQAGPAHVESTRAGYERVGVRANLLPYIEDMAKAYQNTDLVVCRAGAMTVAEVAAAGRAALFIPFPYAVDDHQTLNAQYLVDVGGGLIAQERDLNGAYLRDLLTALIESPKKLCALGRQARTRAMPLATQSVADVCFEVMRG